MDQGNDQTENFVSGLAYNAPFPVIYRRLDGERGISRAFNLMLGIANGNLVMKVDDDDTLTSDAIVSIIEIESTILNKMDYAGVGGLRFYPDGRVIGGEWKHNSYWIDCTNLERYKYGLNGDKAEAYYLSVLQEYGPMPTVSGESYTWEGILWDRIAHAGKIIRWFNKRIYCTEYLSGGATDTRISAREDNFYTYSLFVAERMKYNEIPFMSRLKLCCRYFELLRKKNISFDQVRHYFNDNIWIAYLGFYGSIVTKYIPQRITEY